MKRLSLKCTVILSAYSIVLRQEKRILLIGKSVESPAVLGKMKSELVMINLDSVNDLLEAVCREDIPHGVDLPIECGTHRFNWLDAASVPFLTEITDKILLALARRMVIRGMARQEAEFSRTGYTGKGPVDRHPVSKEVIDDANRHNTFYLNLEERLAKLDHLASINRRSDEVLHFPKPEAAPFQPEGEWVREQNAAPTNPDRLYQVYELMRRTNIAAHTPIVQGPGWYTYDWLESASMDELAESTDGIMLAGSARLAIRASLRLEKAWRQDIGVNDDGRFHRTPLLQDLADERDRTVGSYLTLREKIARIAHKQGIAGRSTNDTQMRKVRRPLGRRKKIATA